MPLNFPRWEELSDDEQKPIYNLPLDRTYIVTGGPGTGKTILAIHRAARLRKRYGEKAKIKFLVFNKPLMLYLRQALVETGLTNADDDDNNSACTAQTWHSWFYKFYYNKTKRKVPEIVDYEPDWGKVINSLELTLKNSLPEWDHLIIDEAQDFPKELLRILRKVTKNATIFADDCQAITEKGCTIADIMNAFNVGDRYYLTKNYRNSVEIYEAAKVFYAGDSNSIPATGFRHGSRPYLISYNGKNEVIERIKNYTENNPGKYIGLFLPDFYTANKYHKELREEIGKQNIQIYYPHAKDPKLNFYKSGIKALAYNVVKGLEFDAVFIPEVTNEYFWEDPDRVPKTKLNMLYMLSTRAKDDLFFFYNEKEDDKSFVVQKYIKNPALVEWE